MFFSEWKKLLKRSICLPVLLMLLSNGGVLCWQLTGAAGGGFSSVEKAAVYRSMDRQKTLKWLDERQAALNTMLSAGKRELNNYPYPAFTSSLHTEIDLLDEVREEANEAAGYHDFLEEVLRKAKQRQASQLSGGETSFVFRDAAEMKKNYEKCRELDIAPQLPDGIRSVTENRITDFLLLLAITVIMISMIIPEKDQGQFLYILPMKNGRKKLFLVKAAVGIVSSVLLTVLFFLSGLLISGCLLRTDIMNAPIQSVYGYISCPYRISVGVYLILYLSLKAFFSAAAGAVALLLAVIFRRAETAGLAFGALWAAEYLVWANTDRFSDLRGLRDFNLIQMSDTSVYFRNYENFNILQYPASSLLCTTVCVALLLSAAGLSAFFLFGRKGMAGLGGTKQKKFRLMPSRSAAAMSGRRRSGFCCHTKILRHEGCKLLWGNRAFFCFALLLAVQLWQAGSLRSWGDEEEYYYNEYCENLKGGLSRGKERYLEAEQERLAEAQQKSERYDRLLGEGKLSADEWLYLMGKLDAGEARTSAYNRAFREYQRLLAWKEQGYEVCYMSQSGWNRAFGAEGKQRGLLALGGLFFFLILGLSNYFAMERQTGMEQLLPLSVKGRRVICRKKAVCGTVFALFLCGAAFFPGTIRMFWLYGMTPVRQSVKSVKLFEWVNGAMSVAGWLAVQGIIALVISAGAGGLIMWLSAKTGKVITTILLSALFLLLPVILLLCFMEF